MNEQQQSLEELRHIKQMMEKSSRFISLSGLSGIAAGTIAIVGAFLGAKMISDYTNNAGISYDTLVTEVIVIAVTVVILALSSGFAFTYLRSKKNGVSIWGTTTYRLVINLAIPLVAGGFLLLRLIQLQYVSLVAPGCLLFYGLALVNASKYTLGEVRYLGYCELILAVINLWVPAHGLIFWTTGFGLLHIIYGIIMWRKYERVTF